jgi:outer membrane lipoprotein-sorting protein
MAGLLLTYVWLAALAVPAAPVAAAPSPEAGRVSVAAPDTGAPEAVAPETVAPEMGAPEAVAPETVAPEAVAPEMGAREGAREPAAQEAAEVLRRTAAAYDRMHSVAADFTQVLRNTLLGRTTESAGTLYQREPDKFLMDFSDPEGDRIVSDGRWFWMYFPSVDEKQVIRTPRRGQGLDLQAQFVGDPVERFEHTYHGAETFRGREAHVFTLEPREPMGYRRMKVWIDTDDWLVRRFEIHEDNGNVRHMELRNVVVDPELPDALFEFTPPEGAIVVERG